MTARLGHSRNHSKHHIANKVRLVALVLLVFSTCFAEQASSVSTRIDVRKAEVASNGMIALETNYGINDMQVRLLDPIKKRVFARIKINNVEDGSYFSNLLADDDRFVFQLKNKTNYSGIYSVDGFVDVKKLGNVNHKLQFATKNWFLFTKDDNSLTPLRYDKELKNEMPGHIPGHPDLIALNGQRGRDGEWLACIKIAEPHEQFSSIKAKLFVVYLADDDSASVYPVGVVEEIIHKKIYIAVSDNEVWLSAGNLHILDKETKTFRHYSSEYRSIAASVHSSTDVLMASWRSIINIEGNNQKPLNLRPKWKYQQIKPLIGSTNKIVHLSKSGEKTVLFNGTKQEHKHKKLQRPPLLPEEKYELIDIDFLERKVGLLNIEPLFIFENTLWCKANSKNAEYYWVRLNLNTDSEPEVTRMKRTLSEKLIAGAKQIGEIIVAIFIFDGPM